MNKWPLTRSGNIGQIKRPQTTALVCSKTIKNGWSSDVLSFQIETRLHERIGQSTNNFELALPPADSDMASQIFKDPYVFDFLGTAEPRRETELEQKLIDELGGLNNTAINNTRHASPLEAHLGGFFYGCKKKRPKGGVGPAILSLGGLYFVKYLY